MEQIWIRSILGILISMFIATRALTKNVVNLSGAWSVILLMSLQIAAGWRYCAMMLVCILISTANKEAREKSIDWNTINLLRPRADKAGTRTWKHVFCNDITATIMVLIVTNLTKSEEKCLDSKGSSILVTALMGGIIGHYSCCFRDTWASDLWVPSDPRSPRITLFMRNIHKVTRLSAGSGVGAAFVVMSRQTNECKTDSALSQFWIIPLSMLVEQCGSITHHILTTLQFTGPSLSRKELHGLDILDYDAVNFLSLLVTSVLTGLACSYLF